MPNCIEAQCREKNVLSDEGEMEMILPHVVLSTLATTDTLMGGWKTRNRGLRP